MAKKKTETVGLIPNGNIVKYDTTETPTPPGKPKRKPRAKAIKCPGPEEVNFKWGGCIDPETGQPEPAIPAPTNSQPAKPQKEFTEKQIQKAGEMFKALLKQGKTLRQARRETERKTGIPILPDNSQPYKAQK